jgi:hypothetical protein
LEPDGCADFVECVYWEEDENMWEEGGLQRRISAWLRGGCGR